MSPPTRLALPAGEGRGRGDMAGEDDIAEPGGEPLDLGVDRRRHVDGRAVGDVAVRPQRVPARRGPRGVEQAGLGDEHERSLAVPALPRRRLGGGDLVERAADVHRCRPRRRRITPRHRRGQGVVDLEGGGPVAEPPQPASIASGEAVAGEVGERMRADVGEHHPRRRQIGERGDRPVALDRAAVARQRSHEGVGDRLRATGGERPPGGVADGTEQHADAGGERSVERQHRVGGEAGEQRPCAVRVEAAAGEADGAAQAVPGEPGVDERMAREAHPRHHVAHQIRRRAPRAGSSSPATPRRRGRVRRPCRPPTARAPRCASRAGGRAGRRGGSTAGRAAPDRAHGTPGS